MITQKPDLTKYVELIAEVKDNLKVLFGDAFISLYGCGSWVRNEMRADSDVDFFFVVDLLMDEEKKTKILNLRDMLRKKWLPRGVPSIDLRFISLQDPDNFFTIGHKEIVQVDGYLLFGKERDWDVYEEYSKEELVTAFVKIRNYVYRKLLKPYSEDASERNYSRRSFAKAVLRTITLLTVLRGGKFSHRVSEFQNLVDTYYPSFSERNRKSIEIYKKETISDEDVAFLDQTFHEALTELKKNNITF